MSTGQFVAIDGTGLKYWTMVRDADLSPVCGGGWHVWQKTPNKDIPDDQRCLCGEKQYRVIVEPSPEASPIAWW